MRPAAPILIAAALALAACGKSQDSTPAAPPPPADAPAAGVDFSRPLNALGAEPFWALKIRPEGLVFSAAAAKDVLARNDGPKVEADEATWTARGGDGAPLTAVLKASVCQDPTSGLNYPFTATVNAGGRALTGCAAYADAMPRPGG
ncbi:MAG TPA: hypothetical protein VL460_08435 [Caulobacteraceae bacterium]|jgi:uncharacterized membrane protein|nr:hypothetical protein [Caulobacteraceae bacterium]